MEGWTPPKIGHYRNTQDEKPPSSWRKGDLKVA